jgi:hypothetical protein
VLAAALTIWVMFSLWLIAGCISLPRQVPRIAMVLLGLELVSLAVWSYGSENCDEHTCAPFAQAAGIAARTDVPILAATFLVITVLRLGRGTRAAAHAYSPGATGSERGRAQRP